MGIIRTSKQVDISGINRGNIRKKINELAMNCNLYRGIDELKRHYQPRNNSVKDENDEQLPDSISTSNKLLDILSVSDIRWIEIHAAEPLVLLRLKLLLQSLKNINHKAVIKFLQNSFKHEVKY
jgi:hypothetical protein